MIDDKKIEAAKEEIYEDRFLLNGDDVVFDNDAKEEMFYKEDIKEAIGLGAKWAINEFLEELWHPASEEPNREGKPILFNCVDHFVPSWCVYPIGFKGNWNVFCNSHGISKWLYIDDLLPKEEGE